MLHPEEQQLYLESYFLVVFLTTTKSYQGNLGVITNFIFMQPDPLLHLNGNKSIKNPEPKLYFKWSGFSQMLLCEFLTFVILFSASQGHTQVNFLSTLLQVTMTDQLDLPVRQAGTVMAL